MTNVCAGGNCVSFIQCLDEFVKAIFVHGVNGHHFARKYVMAFDISRCLREPFSYGVTVANDSEILVFLDWAGASLLSLDVLAIPSSYSSLW